jgi:RNA polymerase sigma factor (TIGR02999 family)
LPAIGRPYILGGMSQLPHILSMIDGGDPSAASQLLPLVYDELRRLAAGRLAQEKPGQTLEPTALVHEAYVRLVGNDATRHWAGRKQFFAAAAESMRRILIDNARRKRGPRGGGNVRRVHAELNQIACDQANVDVIDLDEALDRLAEESPVRAELVKLRFFTGLTVAEAAEVLEISVATAERYWTYARARLYIDLNEQTEGPRSRGSGEKNPAGA